MISIISGTNRPKSNSENVAKYVTQASEERGISSQFYSLNSLPHNIAFAELYGNRSEEFQQIVNGIVANVDKFIFVIPEYNGGFPGILKVFVDAVEPKYWHGKKAALIGIATGRSGNQRGLDHMTNILNYLKMDVLHFKPCLSRIGNDISGELVLTEEYKMLISQQLELFSAF
jgi:chromate reductase